MNLNLRTSVVSLNRRADGISETMCNFVLINSVFQFENGRLYGNTNDYAVRGDDFENVDAIYTDLNKRALKDFHKLHGYFSPKNEAVVLDFGCGSGETTAGMARGELVHERPHTVRNRLGPNVWVCSNQVVCW